MWSRITLHFSFLAGKPVWGKQTTAAVISLSIFDTITLSKGVSRAGNMNTDENKGELTCIQYYT